MSSASYAQVEESITIPLRLDNQVITGPPLHDIRQSSELLDLKNCVVSGLSSSQKSLPSLLLWDEQGLKNFDAWTQCPHYYPKQRELEIIHRYKDEIAKSQPGELVLIELGCGSLTKTALILDALAKANRRVHYHALDVSESALRESLARMQDQFRGSNLITVSGLVGTYEDCARWLVQPSTRLPAAATGVTFLWIGNSVANSPQSQASALLARFHEACQHISLACAFLITADSCAQEDRLRRAYNPETEPSRTFLYHGLHHANRLLGRPVFREDQWLCHYSHDPEQNELHFDYVPTEDLSLDLGSIHVSILEGEKIPYFMSGKWSEAQMRTIAHDAGFQLRTTWSDIQNEYGQSLLAIQLALCALAFLTNRNFEHQGFYLLQG